MSSVNLRGLSNKFRRAEEVKKNVMPKAFAFFKGITPRKSGNARNKTSLDPQNNIRARYAYASVLDEGSSRQAPKGMSEPTIERLKKWVDQYIKNIGAY
jgi:hypothetical protein